MTSRKTKSSKPCFILARTQLFENFFKTINVDPSYNAEWYGDPLDITKKWKVRIGNYVAIKSRQRIKKESWFPFERPWRCAKILNFYTSADQSQMMMEVLLYFTLEELTYLKMKQMKQYNLNQGKSFGSIYGTNIIEHRPLTDLLGPIDLNDQEHMLVSGTGINHEMPQIKYTCEFELKIEQKTKKIVDKITVDKNDHFRPWLHSDMVKSSRALKDAIARTLTGRIGGEDISQTTSKSSDRKRKISNTQNETAKRRKSTVSKCKADEADNRKHSSLSHMSDDVGFDLESSYRSSVRFRKEVDIIPQKSERISNLQCSDVTSRSDEKTSNKTNKKTKYEDTSRKNRIVNEKDAKKWNKQYIPSIPLHVNIAKRYAYFNSFEVTPPYQNYSDEHLNKTIPTLDNKNYDENKRLRVKVGDVVVLDTSLDTNENKNEGLKYFPFRAQWSPAEVVHVWKKLKTKQDAKTLHELSVADGKNRETCTFIDSKDEVMLHVRWFYLKSDLPNRVASKITRKRKDCNDKLDEIFESDHVDDVPALSVLSLTNLHYSRSMRGDKGSNPTILEKLPGVPLLDFCCYRSFSIHHRSGGAVAVGQNSHRIERGFMHSEHANSDVQLRSKLKSSVTEKPSASESSKTITNAVKMTTEEKLQEAIRRCSLSSTSANAHEKGLPLKCRENEQKKIFEFLRSAIPSQDDLSTSSSLESSPTVLKTLFLSGPPGTGKTASVLSVISQLRSRQSKGTFPLFDFFCINAMELRNPFDVYKDLWKIISGSTAGQQEAASKLESYFSGDEDVVTKVNVRPIVLLLDEMDHLRTHKETLLFTIFDWAMREGVPGTLVIIGISNTINLPDLLTSRIQSRVDHINCMFQFYSMDQIRKIVKHNLALGKEENEDSCLSVFQEDAITLAARKTSMISGDIRKAFMICCTAAELALKEYQRDPTKPGAGLVSMRHVQEAGGKLYKSYQSLSIKMVAPNEALLLVAVCMLQSKKHETCSFTMDETFSKMASIANALADQGDDKLISCLPTFDDLLHITNRLAETGIILLKDDDFNPWCSIKLGVEVSEIQQAIRNSSHKDLEVFLR